MSQAQSTSTFDWTSPQWFAYRVYYPTSNTYSDLCLDSSSCVATRNYLTSVKWLAWVSSEVGSDLTNHLTLQACQVAYPQAEIWRSGLSAASCESSLNRWPQSCHSECSTDRMNDRQHLHPLAADMLSLYSTWTDSHQQLEVNLHLRWLGQALSTRRYSKIHVKFWLQIFGLNSKWFVWLDQIKVQISNLFTQFWTTIKWMFFPTW